MPALLDVLPAAPDTVPADTAPVRGALRQLAQEASLSSLLGGPRRSVWQLLAAATLVDYVGWISALLSVAMTSSLFIDIHFLKKAGRGTAHKSFLPYSILLLNNFFSMIYGKCAVFSVRAGCWARSVMICFL